MRVVGSLTRSALVELFRVEDCNRLCWFALLWFCIRVACPDRFSTRNAGGWLAGWLTLESIERGQRQKQRGSVRLFSRFSRDLRIQRSHKVASANILGFRASPIHPSLLVLPQRAKAQALVEYPCARPETKAWFSTVEPMCALNDQTSASFSRDTSVAGQGRLCGRVLVPSPALAAVAVYASKPPHSSFRSRKPGPKALACSQFRSSTAVPEHGKPSKGPSEISCNVNFRSTMSEKGSRTNRLQGYDMQLLRALSSRTFALPLFPYSASRRNAEQLVVCSVAS